MNNVRKTKIISEDNARYHCYLILPGKKLSDLIIYGGFIISRTDNDAYEERMVEVIMELPFGGGFIALIIFGLIGYIIWRNQKF